jgi:small-conductance mechanosensitive channel
MITPMPPIHDSERKMKNGHGRAWGAPLLILACLAAAPLAAQTRAPTPPARSAPAPLPPPRPAAPAPVEADSPAGKLDAAKSQLDQIETAATNEATTDSELARQRAALDPIVALVQALAAEATPKQAALKARLDQLGPAPDPKTAQEDPVVTQERADQQRLFAASDDLVKRAKFLLERADQIAGEISARRRALFANAVFRASSSILSPAMWLDVAHEAPHSTEAAGDLAVEYGDHLAATLSGRDVGLLAGALAALLAALAALILVARRVIPRAAIRRDAPEVRKTAAALWTGLAVVALPIAFAAALVALGKWFGLGLPELSPFGLALWRVIVRCSLAFGMVSAILAPRRPLWRPVELVDKTAQRLSRLIVGLALLVSLGKLVEAANETIGGSLNSTVAARGLFALLAGLALARGLYGIVAAPEDEADETGAPAHLDDESPFWPPIRVAAWTATFAILASTLLGYISLAAFIVDQLAWTAFVAGLLFLLLKLADEGAEAAFQPGARISRSLMATLGLRRESLQQIGVLLAGGAHVALWGAAALLVLAPWGVQSQDMLGAAESAFFGFKLGEVTVSPSSLVLALLFFGLGYGLTHAFQNWLDKSYLPLTQLDQGLRASIRTSIGYIGVLAAFSFAIAYLGLSLEKLAYVAGALSVGIGLGLQSVVNNFVSGLILLWERTIKVGDWVVIGEDQGYVRRINVRATEIETFDRATMIVPNGNMVTSVVKNWVRTDRVGRIKVPLSVVWGTDPEKLREVLLVVAKSHEVVVGIPAPAVMFTALGANALHFELVCFVEDVERAVRVKSDLHFAIFKHFADAGLQICATPQAVSLEIDKAEPVLRRIFSPSEIKPQSGDIKP